MYINKKNEDELNKKIEKLKQYDSEDIYKYSLEYIIFNKKSKLNSVQAAYNESLDRIKQFEEKAKINLIAISISVTIMTGLIKPINDIYEKYQNIYVEIAISLICILIVYFMLFGGITSLKVLMDKNIIYKAGIIELTFKNEQLKKVYGMNGELNELNNTLRNNYINTSYKCIRNALILLMIIFMIGVIPFDSIWGLFFKR